MLQNELYYQACDEDITGNLNFNKDKYKKLIERKEKREKKRVRPPLFKEVVKIKVRP